MISLKKLLSEATLATDADFRDAVKGWEGPGPVDANNNHLAYDDANPRVPAKPGRPITGTLTIGYGTTDSILPTLKPGLKISHKQADALLTKGIMKHEEKARRLIKKYDTYPSYVRKAILNAIYRGDLGPASIRLMNQGAWDKVPAEYLDHTNYKNPAGMGGVVQRMKSNADAFSKYAIELKNPTATKQTTNATATKGGYIGKMIYPRKTSESDYANVRKEPSVNNGLINNIIDTIKWPATIGRVVKEKMDNQNMTWYQVELPNKTLGWVRFDAVTKNKDEKYL